MVPPGIICKCILITMLKNTKVTRKLSHSYKDGLGTSILTALSPFGTSCSVTFTAFIRILRHWTVRLLTFIGLPEAAQCIILLLTVDALPVYVTYISAKVVYLTDLVFRYMWAGFNKVYYVLLDSYKECFHRAIVRFLKRRALTNFWFLNQLKPLRDYINSWLTFLPAKTPASLFAKALLGELSRRFPNYNFTWKLRYFREVLDTFRNTLLYSLGSLPLLMCTIPAVMVIKHLSHYTYLFITLLAYSVLVILATLVSLTRGCKSLSYEDYYTTSVRLPDITTHELATSIQIAYFPHFRLLRLLMNVTEWLWTNSYKILLLAVSLYSQGALIFFSFIVVWAYWMFEYLAPTSPYLQSYSYPKKSRVSSELQLPVYDTWGSFWKGLKESPVIRIVGTLVYFSVFVKLFVLFL